LLVSNNHLTKLYNKLYCLSRIDISFLPNCKRLYALYSDIAKTYYDISKGDYISRLVDEERNKRERLRKKSLWSSNSL